MDYKKLVLVSLKPKVKELGFDKNELESVAAQIANNLNLNEEASEGEAQTAIDTAIDAAVPFLRLSQSAVNRIINAQRAKSGEEDKQSDKNATASTDQKKGSDDVPEWAKQLIESNKALQEELTTIKAEKTTASRKARLEEAVKDAGVYGKSVLRQFERISFTNDDEFDKYLSEVNEDIKSFNQERIDAGLQGLGNPPSAHGGNKQETKITDDELDQMADMFK